LMCTDIPPPTTHHLPPSSQHPHSPLCLIDC
jgi:hypothetical protein